MIYHNVINISTTLYFIAFTRNVKSMWKKQYVHRSEIEFDNVSWLKELANEILRILMICHKMYT